MSQLVKGTVIVASQVFGQQQEQSFEASEVRALYRQLLESWNGRNAAAFAALFDAEGQAVGFDGTTHQGRAGIESDLSHIFMHHQTPAYVSIVRGYEWSRLSWPFSAQSPVWCRQANPISIRRSMPSKCSSQ